MKKKIIFSLLLLISSMSTWSQITTTVGDLNYSISDGVATVTGLATDATDIVIPSTIEYNGLDIPVKKVTGFSKNRALHSVIISEGVTSVGGFGGCTSLEICFLPEGLTRIEANAFAGCSSLTSIRIPSSVQRIYSTAFENCTSLKTIDLSISMLYSISSCAFLGCVALTHISLDCRNFKSNSSYDVFEDCTSLHSIIVRNFPYVGFDNDNFENWCKNNFINCPLLMNFIFINKPTKLPEHICGNAKSYVLSECITPVLIDTVYTGIQPEVIFDNILPKPMHGSGRPDAREHPRFAPRQGSRRGARGRVLLPARGVRRGPLLAFRRFGAYESTL